jgi:hypothetical protein
VTGIAAGIELEARYVLRAEVLQDHDPAIPFSNKWLSAGAE